MKTKVIAITLTLLFSTLGFKPSSAGEISNGEKPTELEKFFEKPDSKFDSKKWISEESRLSMVYDLRHNYELIGLSKKKIHKLLGTPSFTSPTLEKYSLVRGPFCGWTIVPNLELVYRKGSVEKFRLFAEKNGSPLSQTDQYSRWITN